MHHFGPEDEILREFTKIATIFASTMRGIRDKFKEVKTQSDLTTNDMRFIHLLNSGDRDLSVQEIADLAGVTSSTISIKISDLVDKGFIIRERLDDNRRKTKINLSPKSKKLLNRIGVPPLREFSKSLGLLTKEERDQFLPIMKKIVENLKSELDIETEIDHPNFMRKIFQSTMEG